MSQYEPLGQSEFCVQLSFQYIKEYNEALNASASDTQDTYGLKVLLAYYEYFNNFSGY